ncbi:MAG: hypothetical protein COA79_20690 [Planctomycetota bacterium]|nr:MAG: hypothetical protein COA79_20690 [Planctomycetota bacterium]
MKTLNLYGNYLKERFSLFPWFILPFYIFFVGHAKTEQYSFILLGLLFTGILFFRLFDDYFCWDFDQFKQKNSDYLQISKSFYVAPLVFLASIFIIFNVFILNQLLNSLIISCIILSMALYKILKHHNKIIYISLFKYPVLLVLVAIYTNEINFSWVVLASILFFAREILEEEFLLKNRVLEIIPFLLLILAKVTFTFDYFIISS